MAWLNLPSVQGATSLMTMRDPQSLAGRWRLNPNDCRRLIHTLSRTECSTQPAAPKKVDPRLTKNFLEAVRYGDTELMESLLDNVDVNTRGPRDGRSALSIAAEIGNISMAKKTLLDHGALVSICQYSRSCSDGLGSDWNGGRTPLNWASSEKRGDLVEVLQDYGVNPNSINSAGRTALHTSCMKDDRKTAQLLLDRGADGWIPVHEAALNNDDSLLQVLFAYRPLLDNVTFLHLAGNGGWVDASINCKDSLVFETPLHKAARNREVEACGVLCARGANIEMLNIDGLDYQTVLVLARKYPRDWGSTK